jgi:hypothetical protein
MAETYQQARMLYFVPEVWFVTLFTSNAQTQVKSLSLGGLETK